jgi:hypothetical protein
MHRFSWRFLGFCATSALFLSGCAYQTRTPNVLCAVPVPASAEITVIDEVRPLDAATEGDVRREAAWILARTRSPGASTGRMRARVVLEDRRDVYDAMREDGFAFVGLLPAPLGLVTGRERLAIDVVVETDDAVYEGRGEAEQVGGIYAPARRKALALALERALVDASLRGARPVR